MVASTSAASSLLRARWTTAVRAVSDAPQSQIDDALAAVLDRHREPHRTYHGVAHVERVVDHVHRLAAAIPPDQLERHGVDLPALTLAAVFHDAVYEPGSTSNEADSAALADRVLVELGVADDVRRRVAALVLATGHGLHVPGNGRDDAAPVDGLRPQDVDALLDADLAVLGSSPAEYADYATGVRLEHAAVDDEAWRNGRAGVLRALLGRDPLFRSAEGRRLWEHRALANLTAELAQLEG